MLTNIVLDAICRRTAQLSIDQLQHPGRRITRQEKIQQHEDNNKVILIVWREEIYVQEKDPADRKSIVNRAEISFPERKGLKILR